MFEVNMWTYPWDLVDEGIDRALDRLKGEAGVTGVSLAVTYHSIEQLRPHPDVTPRTFRSPGGAQFQPKPELYAATRIRPVVAPWLKKSNPLAAVSEACDKLGLKLRAWTVCCHGSAMVAKYPAFAMKDVFGDSSVNWLCPVNPDVREYLRALVEDLTTHYLFDTVELERPSFPEKLHSHAHHKIGVVLGPVGEFLCNLCFCESCRQAAERDGVNVEAAASAAMEGLTAILSDRDFEASSRESYLSENPDLAAFVDWRSGQIASLVASLKQTSSVRVVVHRVGDHYMTAADWRSIAGACDGLLAPCSYSGDDAMKTLVHEVRGDTGSMAGVELSFNACSPQCPSAEAFVSAVAGAARLGVRSVDVYNYGLLPIDRLEWVRRAARYAHREHLD
ncbi:MAG TPA: hypothetical protein PLL20_09415 [Phycisphaerae bacterium]|nr:hypothetical protein [Phycisphaerae bacterium]HRR85321.1 hypothetical protein [Phycisphaerae bacterium]